MQHKNALLEMIPRGVDGELCVRLFIQQIRSNTDLAKCTQQSLLNSVVDAVQSGLSLGGPQQHCAIIPYKTTAQFQIMYKGWLELSRRTGEIIEHNHGVVHQGDAFQYELGDSPYIKHQPSTDADRKSRPITHFYVSFTLKSGGVIREVWTKQQVDDHRDKYSKAHNKSDSPWKTEYEQMALKTLVLSCFNRGRMPVQASIREVVSRQQQMAAGERPPETKIDTMFAALAPPEPETPAKPVKGEVVPEKSAKTDDDLVYELTMELADAKNLGQCTVIREKYEPLSNHEAYQADVAAIVKDREDAIRAARTKEAAQETVTAK